MMVNYDLHGNLTEDRIKAILDGARTGELGDGKIFVYALDEVVRILTGERGTEAIG